MKRQIEETKFRSAINKTLSRAKKHLGVASGLYRLVLLGIMWALGIGTNSAIFMWACEVARAVIESMKELASKGHRPT